MHLTFSLLLLKTLPPLSSHQIVAELPTPDLHNFLTKTVLYSGILSIGPMLYLSFEVVEVRRQSRPRGTDGASTDKSLRVAELLDENKLVEKDDQPEIRQWVSFSHLQLDLFFFCFSSHTFPPVFRRTCRRSRLLHRSVAGTVLSLKLPHASHGRRASHKSCSQAKRYSQLGNQPRASSHLRRE